jgi:hypothetical protein
MHIADWSPGLWLNDFIFALGTIVHLFLVDRCLEDFIFYHCLYRYFRPCLVTPSTVALHLFFKFCINSKLFRLFVLRRNDWLLLKEIGSSHILETRNCMFLSFHKLFFLPDVSFHVVIQVPLGNKGRRATRLFARIGSETSVRSYMSLQVTLLIEAFPTIFIRTLKGFWSSLLKIFRKLLHEFFHG